MWPVDMWCVCRYAGNANGVLSIQNVPGSHRWGSIAHDDKPEPMNMIKRGQGISGRFDEAEGTFMPVKAGQMSLHHTDLVHASAGNDTDDRRLGYAISYIPAHVKPTGPVTPSALRVRGRSHGHFVEEARLHSALTPEASAASTKRRAMRHEPTNIEPSDHTFGFELFNLGVVVTQYLAQQLCRVLAQLRRYVVLPHRREAEL